MSAREWQPGDLCSMTWDGNMDGHFPVIRGDGRWYMTDYRDCTSEFLTDEWLEKLTAVDLRPLVVIDPENREQVKRLWDAYRNNQSPLATDAMQAALREFANPIVKPDEPTGLGAVVEDADGKRWVRLLRDGDDSTRDDWRRAGYTSGDEGARVWHHWADIRAVKVLSEGVPA